MPTGEWTSAAVKAALSGLTPAQMRTRLNAAVLAEYDKPNDQTDVGFIEACEDILQYMDTGAFYEVDQAPRHQRLMQTAHAREKARRLRGRCLGSVAAAAALLILCIWGDSVFHWIGLVGRSVNHEQAYQIGGMEIDPGLIGGSIADGELPTIVVETQSMDEVINALGFTPGLPAKVPDGAEAHYTIERDSVSTRMVAVWTAEGAPTVSYFLEVLSNHAAAELAAASIKGETVIKDGVTYSFSQNENGLTKCTWHEGYAIYQLQSALSPDELLVIAVSVVPGDEQSGCQSAMRLNTQSIEEASELMSFDVKTPSYVPEGFEFRHYEILASASTRWFHQQWTRPGEKYLLNYSVMFHSYERWLDAGGSGGYEQNCEGRYVTVDGIKYYIAYNCEHPFVVWSENQMDCSISGPTAEEELLRMAISINGGDPLQIPLNSVKQPVALITPDEAIAIAQRAIYEKYGVSMEGIDAKYYMSRMSETHSDYQVEFRPDPMRMWTHAARINAQTGEVVACVDDVHWDASSGTLLLELANGATNRE